MQGTDLSLVTGASPALLVDVPAEATGPAVVSRLIQPFTKPSGDMTIGFDLAPDKLNTKSGGMLVASLEFPWPTGPAPSYYSVRFAFADGRARIEEFVPQKGNIFHPSFDVPKGKFSRITLDVVMGAAGGSIKTSIDGAQVGAVEPLSQPGGVEHTPKLLVGAVYGSTPMDGWKLRIANVTADLR